MRQYIIDELGVQTKAEHQRAYSELVKLVKAEKKKLPAIDSYEKFVGFCTGFVAQTKLKRPIHIEEGSKIKKARLDKLVRLQYPAEFINWVTDWGHLYFWLEAVKIADLDRIAEELDELDLLTQNNYLFITTDMGGGAFVYDMNEPGHPLKYIDGAVTSSDELEDLYSEYYGFYYDEDEESWENEKNLVKKYIYNDKGEFDPQSKYVKAYLKKQAKKTKFNALLPFLLVKTAEGFKDILNRYKPEA